MLRMMGESSAVVPGGSETELIERARRGDRQAFGLLVEAHLSRVWRVVWRTLRHREDTEDVVQEVFLAAYRALPAFRGEASFSSWLHRIAMTRSFNHLDRAAEKLRRSSQPLETRDDRDARGQNGAARARPALRGLASPDQTPLQALETKELARRLADCLGRMPAAWRGVIALHCESYSYEEIAEALGVALGTVRSRLARARLALRRCVEEAKS